LVARMQYLTSLYKKPFGTGLTGNGNSCLRVVRLVRRIAAVVLGSWILLAVSGLGAVPLSQTWEKYPWISFSGGYENDRILERGPDVITVPGGPFIDVMPGLLVSRVLGERTRLNLDGQLTLEHFNNDENRSLFGAMVNADLRRRVGRVWRWRLTVGGNYFADSFQETVDRYHAGAETAFGLSSWRGYLELLVGGQGRNYPNLVSQDESGIPGTYTELGVSIGATGAIRPISRLMLSGLIIGQSTDARDPVYDSNSLLAQAGIRVYVAGPLALFMSGMAQERVFSARQAGEDSDSYQQLGAGLEIPLGRSFELGLRYAVARYTDPLGAVDNTQRLSLGFTWWPGGRGTRSLPDMLPPLISNEKQEIIRSGEPHLFRVRAPLAGAVSLVSDFNSWDPSANPLSPAGDGWWEAPIALSEGLYQYAYWVDGNLVTPSEAEVIVDDGFGGRNGLLRVEPD
jgi:hypothetical protein